MIFEETVVLSKPIAEAVQAVKASLAAVGFGVLTEIDLQATLKTKIDTDIEPHIIIGACNPGLAARAIEVDPQIGVLLPCNVVVRQSGPNVIVEAMDPGLMSKVSGNTNLEPIAAEARNLMNDALRQMAANAELTSGH